MKVPNIRISDLITLDGLEKPGDGVVKEILENPVQVARLCEAMTGLAGKLEASADVRVGDIANLVMALRNALVKKLSAEDAAKTLGILKKRFLKKRKHYKNMEGANWDDVEKKLQDSPEKLWSLKQMEQSGGEPDLIGYDQVNGQYIFIDCSKESPKGRRNCVYDREAEQFSKEHNLKRDWNGNVEDMMLLMGEVELLTEETYRLFQSRGEFDKKTWSFLKTPDDQRKEGLAHTGNRDGKELRFGGNIASFHSESGAFRVLLKV